MSESKQAVVSKKDDEEAMPSSEPKIDAHENGGDDLEKLLSEFDDSSDESNDGSSKSKGKEAPKAEPKTADASELYDMVREIRDRDAAREQENQRREFETDMKDTVKQVRGDIPANAASDRLIRAWIDGMAEDNPKLAKAWVNRKKDPAAFNRVVAGLSKEFAKEFSKRPDPNVTEDREAVAAAVRGASTKAPEDRPPNYGSMSDGDFASDIEKKFGFRPF